MLVQAPHVQLALQVLVWHAPQPVASVEPGAHPCPVQLPQAPHWQVVVSHVWLCDPVEQLPHAWVPVAPGAHGP